MATQALERPIDPPAAGVFARIVERIPPIPARSKPHGPLTAARLRRFYAFLAVFFAAGIAPLVLGLSAPWQAFGLGLIFPGAGFLYAGGFGGVIFAALTVAFFAVVMFLWWARGPILAPPAVILASALLAAAWIGDGGGVAWLGYAIPAAVAGLHLYLALGRRAKFAEQQAKGIAINALIAKAQPILVDAPIEAAREMPDSQVAEFRRMLDLALQPVDSWNGFSMDDTWQDGALRYQICTMSWNLAFGQYTQLPAFHGYLNTAQENLIRKHVDRKTWNYWYWESLWGNFKLEKNPVATDNIMLSGFLGVSLGLFETASGTSPFAAPGALTYRWDEKTAFPYSHETLLGEVVKNYKRYDLGWFPCEPKWIYSMCNLVGRTSLALHDARHGTNLIGQVGDRFEQTMEQEMMMADGRIKVCTSSPFGFQVPSLSGLFGETWGMRFLTPHAPEQAERLWQVLKHEFIGVKPDGNLDFKLLPLGWDTRKPANFSSAQWPDLYPLMMTLWSALEMGDEEIIAATRKTMDDRYGAGMADSQTWTGRNTVRDMVNTGLPEAWRKGPLLAEASYPEVIVTRAVSDGAALDLVLRAGDQPCQTRLGFARLTPGASYRVVQTGEKLTAAADGTATLDFALGQRSELRLVPAP
jgi:Linalool dehydratase/isomerase